MSDSDDDPAGGDPWDTACRCCPLEGLPRPALAADCACDCECHAVDPDVRSRLAERGVAVGPAAYAAYLERSAAPGARARDKEAEMGDAEEDECPCCCIGAEICSCKCRCDCHDRKKYTDAELAEWAAVAPGSAGGAEPKRSATELEVEALPASDLEPAAALPLTAWVVREALHAHPLQLCEDPYSYRVPAPPQAPHQGGWDWSICWSCDLCADEARRRPVYHCALCDFDVCPACALAVRGWVVGGMGWPRGRNWGAGGD